MQNLKFFIGILSLVATIAGCSNSSSLASAQAPTEPFPERKSPEWCQNNYSSASVSARERQTNAKHCEDASRRAYMDAQRELDAKS